MKTLRLMILLFLLQSLPLIAQEGPLVYVLTDGRAVHIILHNQPPGTAGFEAYRRGPDDESFLPMTTSAVTPVDDPYKAYQLYQSDAGWLGRKFDTTDPVRLWNKLKVNRSYAQAYSLISPGLRMALGRTLVDQSVTPGRTYRYRIKIIDNRGNELETVNRRITVEESDVVEAPRSVEVQQEKQDFFIEWEYRSYRGRSSDLTVGFHIYRRRVAAGETAAGAEVDGVRLNAAPVLRVENYLSYYDREAVEGVEYRYGIQAIDMIGRVSEVLYSAPVVLEDTSPPLVPMGLTAVDQTEGVQLVWNLSPEEDVQAYHLYRSDSLEGEFERINRRPIPFDQPQFTDTKMLRGKAWFYKVSAVDAAGNESPPCGAVTIIPNDSTPPAAVSGLQGEVDPEERAVQLRWNPSPAADLKGYFVYRVHADQNMLRITPKPLEPSKSPVFSDRSSHKDGLLPGAEYRYLVSAVDLSGNEGERSSIRLEIPDLVPPRKVFSFSARATRSGSVQLRWQPSLSRDLQTHRVYRRSEADKQEPRLRVELPAAETSYEDTQVQRGSAYTYYVVEVDEVGNSSEESAHRRVVPVDNTDPGPPQELSVRRTGRRIRLSWNPPEDTDVIGYHIYRAAYPDAKTHLISSGLVEATEILVDFSTASAVYTVRAFDSSGNEGQGASVQLQREEE